MLEAASAFSQLLVQHARRPAGRGRPNPVLRTAHRASRLCGDEVTLYLAPGSPQPALWFEARGCMLTLASASILVEQSRLLPFDAWSELPARLRKVLETDVPDAPDALRALGDVRRFPARTACVLHAWEALEDLLKSATGASSA